MFHKNIIALRMHSRLDKGNKIKSLVVIGNKNLSHVPLD